MNFSLKTLMMLNRLISKLFRIKKYANWNQAKSKSDGYDSDIILNKVVEATTNVIKGNSKHERDGVNLERIEFSWPLISFFLYLFKIKNIKNICDFGGSLGTTFYQLGSFYSFPELKKWVIIEQEKFVKSGKRISEDPRLFFSTDLNQIDVKNCQVLLLSSVLQYIEEPYDILQKMLSKNIAHILVDRTPFALNTKNDDFIIVQKVSEYASPVSYPAWVFNKAKFIAFFEKNNFILKYDFIATDPGNIQFNYLGFYFEKQPL